MGRAKVTKGEEERVIDVFRVFMTKVALVQIASGGRTDDRPGRIGFDEHS